jgi:hypothetical protein
MIDILEIIKWGGYPLAVAAFFYGKWIERKIQKGKYKDHIIKGIRKAKLKRDEIENLNDDDLWERASRFMR